MKRTLIFLLLAHFCADGYSQEIKRTDYVSSLTSITNEKEGKDISIKEKVFISLNDPTTKIKIDFLDRNVEKEINLVAYSKLMSEDKKDWVYSMRQNDWTIENIRLYNRKDGLHIRLEYLDGTKIDFSKIVESK